MRKLFFVLTALAATPAMGQDYRVRVRVRPARPSYYVIPVPQLAVSPLPTVQVLPVTPMPAFQVLPGIPLPRQVTTTTTVIQSYGLFP